MTGDADVIAFLSDAEATALIAAASAAGFDANAEAETERLRTTGTLRFRLPPFQLDIITASLPFEDMAYVARRHADHLDWTYLEGVARELCELGEHMGPLQRLDRVRAKANAS